MLVIAVAGTGLAVLGAIAASPHLPFGVARRADPDPGLHADWFVLGLGALGLIAIVVAIASVEALHSTRIAPARRGRSAGCPGSPHVGRHGRRGASPRPRPPACGWRLSRAGPSTAPCRCDRRCSAWRSGRSGCVRCSCSPRASGQLSSTPRHYGWGFDFRAESIGDQACRTEMTAAHRGSPGSSRSGSSATRRCSSPATRRSAGSSGPRREGSDR